MSYSQRQGQQNQVRTMQNQVSAKKEKREKKKRERKKERKPCASQCFEHKVFKGKILSLFFSLCILLGCAGAVKAPKK